nr:serine hydrolase [Azospirillum oleiclasticum]
MTVVQDGRLVASWGPQDRKVNVRSVRKSLLGLLYGIAVAEGRIDLDRSLDRLGIDDREPRLTAAEKRATIRHLLKARSGVYHPTAYENDAMKAKRPPRGSAGPDERWYYNNWDFNALGTIYERLTGEDIFRGFESRIARPIGMQDYMAADGRRVFDPASDHPAYVMALTARDLARVGHLVLNRGNWNGRTVVPAAWIAESVTAWSATDAGSLGYGYLWWTLPPAGRFGPGASLALGSDGQAIGVVPRLRLAVAQLCSDATKRPRRVRGADAVDLLGLVVEAAG